MTPPQATSAFLPALGTGGDLSSPAASPGTCAPWARTAQTGGASRAEAAGRVRWAGDSRRKGPEAGGSGKMVASGVWSGRARRGGRPVAVCRHSQTRPSRLGPDAGSILCAWGTRSVPRKLRLTLHGVAERRSGGTRAPQGLSLRLSGIAKGPSAGQGRPHPRCPNAPAPPGSPCSPPPMCTRLLLLRELWRPRG